MCNSKVFQEQEEQEKQISCSWKCICEALRLNFFGKCKCKQLEQNQISCSKNHICEASRLKIMELHHYILSNQIFKDVTYLRFTFLLEAWRLFLQRKLIIAMTFPVQKQVIPCKDENCCHKFIPICVNHIGSKWSTQLNWWRQKVCCNCSRSI